MASKKLQLQIKQLKEVYEQLKPTKGNLLILLRQTELAEHVYDSNAIENSSLSLRETESILIDQPTARKIPARELFEAKNLARVINHLAQTKDLPINRTTTLRLHKMLLTNINDRIAGRFRTGNEYIQVGNHLAPAPEHIEKLFKALLDDYNSSHDRYFLDNIARFHLEFERIHPFVDGNGRIGRVIINWQLDKLGYPPIILRNKNKHQQYYPVFSKYNDNGNWGDLTKILGLALQEALNKYLAYLKGQEPIRLVDWAKKNQSNPNALLNAARRQTIAAFRGKGAWMIGE